MGCVDRCGGIRERHQDTPRIRWMWAPVSVEGMDERGCGVSVGGGQVSM